MWNKIKKSFVKNTKELNEDLITLNVSIYFYNDVLVISRHFMQLHDDPFFTLVK